jgi:hypothetical protein
MMGSWERLPLEISRIILETVADDYNSETEPYARADYASVCQEWQAFFERRTFRRLVLDQERIHELERYMCQDATRYRQDYLKHLFLRVRLGEYDCTTCEQKETARSIM